MRWDLLVMGVFFLIAAGVGYASVAGPISDCNSAGGQVKQALDPGYQQSCAINADVADATGVVAVVAILLIVLGLVLEEHRPTPAAHEVSPLAQTKWRCAKCKFVNVADGYMPPGTKAHCSACGTRNTIRD